MRLYTKLFVGALAATALFASLATSASARMFSISNRSIRTAFAPLTFSGVGAPTIRCNLTIEGSFHSSTISKAVNSLIGYITRATFDTRNCSEDGGGPIRLLVRQETIPWHIRYSGFIGTLPNVRARVQIVGMGVDELNFPPFGICRFTIAPFFILEGPVAGGGVDAGAAFIRAEEIQEQIPTNFCPAVR